MQIPENAKEMMEQKRTVGFATSSSGGVPNCAPMLQYWWFGEGVLVVGDMYMKMTKMNILENGIVSFSVWDDESGESYKFVGRARYETEGPAYEMANENLHKKKPDKNFKGVVVVDITAVYDTGRGPEAGSLIAGES